MNHGCRHIDGASKKASKAVVGSVVLLLFSYTLLEKRLLGTALEKDYENTSCMFNAIPLM